MSTFIPHEYSLANNFGGDLKLDQFKAVVKADPSFGTKYRAIKLIGDVVAIYFTSQLNPTDKATLDGYVANYQTQPEFTPITFEKLEGTDIVQYKDSNNSYHRFLANQPNEVEISLYGQGDFTSLSAAIAAVNTPGTVYKLHAGVYIEPNPIILPPSTSLEAVGRNPVNCIIAGTDSTKNIIHLSVLSRITGVLITGASSPGACGVYFDGSLGTGLGYSVLDSVFVKGCFIGVLSDKGPDTLYCTNLAIIPHDETTPYFCGIQCRGGGQYISVSAAVVGPAQMAISVEEPGSKLSMTTSSIGGFTYAAHANNGGWLELWGFTTSLCGTSICVGPDGSSIVRATNLTSNNAQLYDLDIQSANADINIVASDMSPDKINNPNKVKINTNFHTNSEGDIFSTHTGELRIGTIEEPSKTAMGEGKYNTNSMTVLWNDNLEVGTWTDVTQFAVSDQNDPFGLFYSASQGNCTYIGSTKPLVGIKVNMITKVVAGADLDDFVFEYWGGTGPEPGWIPFNVMSTSSSAPAFYTPVFINHDVKQHLRFGLKTDAPFVEKTLLGITKKWVRIRLLNHLTNLPSAEYIYLHTNSRHVNKDGSEEYFGMARPTDKFQWNIAATSPTGYPLGDGPIYIGKNLGLARLGNQFQNDEQDQLGFVEFLPVNIDTSFPIKLELAFVGDSNVAGNVQFKVRWDTTNDGSAAYTDVFNAPNESPNESYKSEIVGVPVSSANRDLRAQILIDIQNIHPQTLSGKKDLIWITIERDARNSNNIYDDYPGNITIVQSSAYYVTWRSGGHLSGF